MSKFYGVLTVGDEDNPDQVMRASRVSDDFMTAEVCSETHTYRLSLYADGSAYLDRVPSRWQEAQGVDEEEWEWLWNNEDDDITTLTVLDWDALMKDGENDLLDEIPSDRGGGE